MTKIVVVGAGVVGLTCAHELLKDPTNEVTIVSQQFPTDFDISTIYTSPIAGANWLSFASDDDKFTQEIDMVGYKKFKELTMRPESGVTPRKESAYIPIDNYGKKFFNQLPWFLKNGLGKQFGLKVYADDEYDTDMFSNAYEFDGYNIRTSYYMTFLINEMWKMSGSAEQADSRFAMVRKSISKLSDAYKLHHQGGVADLIVNCTGFLAKELEDLEEEEKEKIYPVRGIVFVAENSTGMKKNTLVDIYDPQHPDEKLYFMPRREGELIMGGVFEENSLSRNVDPTFLHRLIERCQKYLKQYNWDDLKIVRTQVGYRPFRKGGYRIERCGKLIHCYGLGSAGFQSSWGCAKKVTELVSIFKSRSKI